MTGEMLSMPISGEQKTRLEGLISPATLRKLGPKWLEFLGSTTFADQMGQLMRKRGLTAEEAGYTWAVYHEATWPSAGCIDECVAKALKAWNGD